MIHAENQGRDREGHPGRRFWNEDVEARSAQAIAAQQRDGFAHTWEQLWAKDLAFCTGRYAAAGVGAGTVPALDDVPLTVKADLRADEAAHPPFGTHRAVSL